MEKITLWDDQTIHALASGVGRLAARSGQTLSRWVGDALTMLNPSVQSTLP